MSRELVHIEVWYVVPGVVPAPSFVVSPQQLIDLTVDKHIGCKTRNPTPRYISHVTAARAGEQTISFQRLQARLTDSVTTG